MKKTASELESEETVSELHDSQFHTDYPEKTNATENNKR